MSSDMPNTDYVPASIPFKLDDHNWEPQRGSYIHCVGNCPLIHPHGHKLPDNMSLNRNEEGWYLEKLY